MLRGNATQEGTRLLSQRHPELTYWVLGETGIRVSEAGFGGYRIDASVQAHRTALQKALLGGINLIDTSANYTDGGSERLIGSVLTDLFELGQLQREQVVVVSKAGYLQGENYQLSWQKKQQNHPFPDLVEYDDGLEHCIHPVFLQDQLSRSLQRLQLDCIDCYLLHNPEYYLRWAAFEQVDPVVAKAEYFRRIRLAFKYLETEVQAGRIGSYGISSNTFVKTATDYDFSSLSEIWDIACEISPRHHFRLIELPINLLEPEAVTRSNQPNGKSVLQWADEKRLGVLVNRPLNAIRNDRLIRLADNVYQKAAARQAREFAERVGQLDPDWQVSSLSRLALRALRSTAGISSVLVGMRQESYVDEILAELRTPCEKKSRLHSWQQSIKAWETGV